VCGGIPPHTHSDAIEKNDCTRPLLWCCVLWHRPFRPGQRSPLRTSHRNAKMHDVCSCHLLLPTANQMWLWVWWRRGSENVSGDFIVLWVSDVATVTPSLSQCEAAGRGGQRAVHAKLSFHFHCASPKKKIVVWTWVERGVSRRASRAKHKIERRCGVGCRPVWVRQRGHEW
jgi:hypothetical protein